MSNGMPSINPTVPADHHRCRKAVQGEAADRLANPERDAAVERFPDHAANVVGPEDLALEGNPVIRSAPGRRRRRRGSGGRGLGRLAGAGRRFVVSRLAGTKGRRLLLVFRGRRRHGARRAFAGKRRQFPASGRIGLGNLSETRPAGVFRSGAPALLLPHGEIGNGRHWAGF